MPLELFERRLPPGSALRGRAGHVVATMLRLRGEATTFRPVDTDGPGQRGWMAETEVLLWEERSLGPGEEEFEFPLPASCPPTALGQRMRVAYFLELYGALDGRLEATEFEIVALPEELGDGRRVPLELVTGQFEDAPEPPAAEDLPAGMEAPSSWLAQFLQGKNRMDKILERAVRGKLVEPEDLLAMQASMYGYSKGLSQIQPGPQEADESTGASTQAGSFVLDRAEGAIRVRLELAPGLEVQEARATLSQRETTWCHGIESQMERTVGRARMVPGAPAAIEIELPRRLAPSVESSQLRLGYVLMVSVQTSVGRLQGSAVVPITG